MPAIHHTAIVTGDIDASLKFWRDGLGLVEMFDHVFTGDWRTLFGADTDELRSIFLGDPGQADSGIVELVQFAGIQLGDEVPTPSLRRGFFLVSLERDVDDSLAKLQQLGFVDDVRRIALPAPGGKTVVMAVVTAPDGVLVELIGRPA